MAVSDLYNIRSWCGSRPTSANDMYRLGSLVALTVLVGCASLPPDHVKGEITIEGSRIGVGYHRDRTFPTSVRFEASAVSIDDTPVFDPEDGQVGRIVKQRTAILT